MRSEDFDAVVYGGSVYCVECLPDGVTVDSDEVSPIFADSEWDYYPVCDNCFKKFDYVNLTQDGILHEAENQGIEVFYHDAADSEPDTCWIDEDGTLPSGWYWWSCLPGCLPDGEPNGPFEDKYAAAADAIGF